MTMKTSEAPTLMTLHDVLAELGVGRATLYRMMGADFPLPLKVGHSNRWIRSEVLAWLAGRPRASVRQE